MTALIESLSFAPEICR
jgi:hypothetical protein